MYVFGLQNGPKSIPKSLRNRVPILTRLRVQICSVLGALWAPQNRPKIASRTLWAHLAVLKLHLGASRSPHAHFGSSWAHLDPPGGRFWLHFGASWANLDPTKAQFGTTEGVYLRLSLAADFCTNFQNQNLKKARRSARERFKYIYIYIYMYTYVYI